MQARFDAQRERVPFSEAIPLGGQYMMATHEVSGPLTFMPSDPTPAGSCKLLLIADGVHEPLFPQFHRAPGRYRNEPGVPNAIELWFQGGSLFFVRISLPPLHLVARLGAP